MNRADWRVKISELVRRANSHTEPYSYEVEGHAAITIHPSVYSPRYFPETLWYARQIRELVLPGSEFLEIGTGSGLICAFASEIPGVRVTGVDINPYAVEYAQKNVLAFTSANGKDVLGKTEQHVFLESDVYDALDDVRRYDVIFWNHPWQDGFDSDLPSELASEHTLDRGYESLRRYVNEGRDHLNADGGRLLLGTSCYANLDHVARLVPRGYSVLRTGSVPIGDGVVEEYYVLQLHV